MSYDTIDRLNTHFKDIVADPEGIYALYAEDNGDMQEPADGPFFKVFIEPHSDEKIGVEGAGLSLNNETGVMTIQILIEKGMGNKETYRLITLIRDTYDYLLLSPTGDQEGTIQFISLDVSRVGDVPRQENEYSEGILDQWFRVDAFLLYSKNYCVGQRNAPIKLLFTVDSDLISADDETVTADNEVNT
jgi:hypothetical protein